MGRRRRPRNTSVWTGPSGRRGGARRGARRWRSRSTRNRRWPPARWQWPEEVEAAVLGLEDVRVDVAHGAGVAAVGVVVEPDPAALAAGLARSTLDHLRRRRRRGRCRAPGRRRCPSTAASLATPVASAPSASAPGRASTEAPAVSRATAWSGVSRWARLEHLGVVDPHAVALLHHVDERVGGVRREAHQPDDLEVGGQLRRRDAEPGADLVDGRAVLGRDPRDHGQQALQPLSRRARGRLIVATTCSSQATSSSRSSGGSSTSAWSRKPSTNDRNASRLVTGSSTTTAPSSSACTTWSGPDVLHRPPGLLGVDAHPGGDAPRPRRGPRPPGRRPGVLGGGGTSNGGSSRSATAPSMRSRRKFRSSPCEWSRPGEVPAAPLELEPVRVDAPLACRGSAAPPASARDTAPKSTPRFGSAGRRGDPHPDVAAPGVPTRPPSFRSPGVGDRPSTCTADAARWSAASSSVVRPGSRRAYSSGGMR